MVNEFQAGRFDSVLAGIEAAGVGYTMTRSADVFIFEIDWTPGLMKQPIDRIHRRGQDRQCNVYWFVIDGTIDAHIARLFSAKDQRAQSTLGDHLVGMFSPIALRDHRVHAFYGA
jgi:SNF2 family DNA or RNA helicase